MSKVFIDIEKIREQRRRCNFITKLFNTYGDMLHWYEISTKLGIKYISNNKVKNEVIKKYSNGEITDEQLGNAVVAVRENQMGLGIHDIAKIQALITYGINYINPNFLKGIAETEKVRYYGIEPMLLKYGTDLAVDPCSYYPEDYMYYNMGLEILEGLSKKQDLEKETIPKLIYPRESYTKTITWPNLAKSKQIVDYVDKMLNEIEEHIKGRKKNYCLDDFNCVIKFYIKVLNNLNSNEAVSDKERIQQLLTEAESIQTTAQTVEPEEPEER